jgi:deoxyribodipyrimidine photo-lyase
MSIAIVWFRRDLRLADNPALTAALRTHDAIVPVYIHAPDEEAPWAPGAASRWWLHHALAALDAELGRRGARLHIAAGASLPTLRRLVAAAGASAVYWNRLYEPALVARDAAIKDTLRGDAIDAHSFNGALLCEPWDLMTGAGTPYKVFTPYWRTARARLDLRAPLPVPQRIVMPPIDAGLALDRLELLPRVAWDTGLAAAWTPGEASAQRRLQAFCSDSVADYAGERDIPAHDGTTRLSAHLHFGELSPMQIAWALADAAHAGRAAAGAESCLRELGWREFSQYLIYHFPQSTQQNLNARFDSFEWREPDPAVLARWQRGRTGIPIIDAGMRELWTSGWMHNRVRMLVASFLTKNLRAHWLHGARWFWDTLVDADLGNNTQGWQWTAGTGVDASPYFRIFNPVTQGERFDPQGEYVRRWVPELSALDAQVIHAPWRDPACLRKTGYLAPLVDLAASRQDALDAYRDMPAA